jgi:hypothetical protein
MAVIVPPASSVASIENAYFVEVRILTAGEATAKEITLGGIPPVVEKVTLDLVGGTSQQYGLDFTVSGQVLSWDGLALETVLTEGDKLRIIYPV